MFENTCSKAKVLYKYVCSKPLTGASYFCQQRLMDSYTVGYWPVQVKNFDSPTLSSTFFREMDTWRTPAREIREEVIRNSSHMNHTDKRDSHGLPSISRRATGHVQNVIWSWRDESGGRYSKPPLDHFNQTSQRKKNAEADEKKGHRRKRKSCGD